jgi:hypothetical protein
MGHSEIFFSLLYSPCNNFEIPLSTTKSFTASTTAGNPLQRSSVVEARLEFCSSIVS